MRRLHDFKTPYPDRAYVWYTARQQRRGAHHLLIVPTAELDTSRMVVPSDYRYTEQGRTAWRSRMADQGRDIAVPSVVMPEMAMQWCNRTQTVRHWEHDAHQISDTRRHDRPRGYCERCWAAITDAPGIAATVRRLVSAQTALTLDARPEDGGHAVQRWRDTVMRRLHVG